MPALQLSVELGDRPASGIARRRCRMNRAPAGLALGRVGCGGSRHARPRCTVVGCAPKSGSHLTRRWREMDSNPRSPVRSLTQTRSNGDVQHPCAASRMTIGTQIGFAIGGFAPVVAAAVQGEGPNALVPVAPLNSPIGVVAWTARETQHSDARLRVNPRLPTLTPPRFGAKRLEQRRDWRISENMIGVRS
jgi:hypothetical protein